MHVIFAVICIDFEFFLADIKSLGRSSATYGRTASYL